MATPDHLYPHTGSVSGSQRAALLQQKPVTFWLTGLSASGKSTLAYAFEERLVAEGRTCFVLDGDLVRQGLNKDLGFSDHDRSENIRRVAEVAKLMNEAGLIVITAFISPFATDRAMAKSVIGHINFIEVYLNAPLEVCETRDPKGLYKKARAGKLPQFTGVAQPYETPQLPDICIDSAQSKIQDGVQRLLEVLELRKA
jgi:adenylylsulfate kinase